MTRHFTLTNSVKEVVDLNGLDVFGYKPEGLGIKVANSYVYAGSDFMRMATSQVQGQFSIRLLFGAESGGSYEQLSSFATFLSSSPYVLTYETDAGTFRRDCVLSELTKSEIGEYGVLDEELTLDFISPWYRWVTLKSRLDETGEFSPSAYGKTYAATPSINPPKVELIDDPSLANWSSLSLTDNFKRYCQLTDVGAPFSGNSVLIIDGGNMQLGDSSVAFNSGATVGYSIFEMYYKTDELDSINGEFSVAGCPRVMLEDAEITGIAQNLGGETIVFLPHTTSTAWHKITLFFDTPTSAVLRPRNRRRFTYFTNPSLYEVAIDTGGATSYCYCPHYVYEDSTAVELNQFGVFQINNNSKSIVGIGSPCVIRISGGATNPAWRLLVGSQVLQSDGYFVSLGSTESLEVSSLPTAQLARLTQQGAAQLNVYNKQDLTKTNFITIPSGASTLIFEGVSGTIDVSYREEHDLI